MLKVKYQQEIHIFNIEERNSSLQSLKRMVSHSFRHRPQRFHFCYFDAEGDEIDIASDQDLQAVLLLDNTFGHLKGSKIPKICIKEDPKQTEEEFILIEEEQKEDSFELLSSEQPSQSEELISIEVEQFESTLVEDSIDNYDNIISEVVKTTLEGISDICIEKAIKEIEESMVSQEINSYMDGVYKQIASTILIQQAEHYCDVIANESSQIYWESQEELIKMIQSSLKKLLPDFLDRLKSQAIDAVKKIIEDEHQPKAICY